MDLTLCRLCYQNTGTTYIFDKENGIKKKIMFCCPNIRIEEEDGLPASVCSSCEEELSTTYQFVLRCEKIDLKLRSAKDNGNEIKLKDSLLKHEDIYQYELDDHTSLKTDHDESSECIKTISSTTIKVRKTNIKKSHGNKGNGQLQCNHCGKLCKYPSLLAAHLRIHSDHRGFQCPSCDKTYKDSAGLKRHIERNHSIGRRRTFICETCGKAFYTKYDMKIHHRTHTGVTLYACKLCSVKFTQIGTLKRHNLRHSRQKPFSCSKCDKKFASKDSLRQHQDAHSTEKKYDCTTCNTAFKYKSTLRKHMQLHSAGNQFICDHCHQTFTLKGNLRCHIERMHSDKSGFCGICSKDVPDIELHMSKHSGNKPFKCEMCPSSYNSMRSLSYHVNFKHKNNDRYRCSINECMVTFPSQAMLKFHVAKHHDSATQFPCDKCSKGFFRQSDLTKHNAHYHIK